MKTLIQSQLATIPATTGTQIYKTQFASDKNFSIIDGIACILVSGSTSGTDVEIEFRDDNGVIFTFSPLENWVKNAAATSKDLTQLFRAVDVTSKGRNIYCNVKAKNTAAELKFMIYYRQTNEAASVKKYNFASFDFNFGSLPSYQNITLPTQFAKVVGVAATTANANAAAVAINVENSQTKLVDDLQLAALQITANTPYDLAFMPIEFPADGQELKIYAKALTSSATSAAGKLIFLLTD